MLQQFMSKMTAQKQEYDEERREAEEETRKARAEIARAQQKSFPSSLVQTLPDMERSGNLGDVEKTLGELQGRMRDQLSHFSAAGRKDQLEEDLELKRMKRAFPGSLAQTTEEKRPQHHHHHGHSHHHSPDHISSVGHHHHHGHSQRAFASDFEDPLAPDGPTRESLRKSTHDLRGKMNRARASALVQAVQQPALDDSKLNADLASFSDATNELGKEENQMKTDAAKFAADMDAATVNAGSFLQIQDRSDEGGRAPSSLAEMGETTALSAWRKNMEERRVAMMKRSEEAKKLLTGFKPMSLLETGSKDLPDFGSDDLDGASSEPDLPSFDHPSDSFDPPDFSPPSDSSDTDSLSPSLNFGDTSLDDPSTPSSDFGGSTFGHEDSSSFDSEPGSSLDSGLGSSPDFSTPDFSKPSDTFDDSSFSPTEPSADFGSSSSDDALGSGVPSFGAGDPLFDTSGSDSLDAWHPSSLVETKTKVDTTAKKARAEEAKMTKKASKKATMAKRLEADDRAHLRRK
jgi:hypothetical protein